MVWRLIVLVAIFSLQGCAKQPQSVLPVPVAKAAPAKKAQPQVVILVSENIPAYTEVAKALAMMVGPRSSIQNMTTSPLENLNIIKELSDSEHTQIVSIGLNASISAKALNDKQLIFCQVYNYQDYALISARHKGVSMLPSLQQTFKTWRALSPSINNIGVISGPGFDDVIQTAKTAAKVYGIKLHHETVNSDKEYQYAYKKLSKNVQGYWLMPDNRVLSENTLRDIMNFSVRNSKQVAVFNDELLKLGGLLSMSSDYHDIAQQVYERLEQAQSRDNVPGPDIVYLDKMNLRINAVMARNLGIRIPVQYRKSANVP